MAVIMQMNKHRSDYSKGKKFRYLIGIDEAGRGPLAGPVAVGVVVTRISKKRAKMKDSKQLTETQREAWFTKIKEAKKTGELDFAVSLVSHQVIDKKGISVAIKIGIERCLIKLKVQPSECKVLLDGSLKAPEEFLNQKTIIRGDESEPIIALASIVAKVTRDRHMVRIAKKYPNYGFEIHKGYGTIAHRRAIVTHGLSLIHRRTFCRSFIGLQ